MRHALITAFAAFFGVLVALFVFHFYEKYDADRVQAMIDADLQKKVEQGRRLAEQSIAEERAAQAIREAMVVAFSARNSVSESYMSSGRMPASNAQTGLGEPETYRGQSLLSMQVSEGGRIVLTFDATSSVEGGTVVLTPNLDGNESMGVQWKCVTHDYPLIARAWPYSPGCEYVQNNSPDDASR
ncbi:pilin [Dokdonella sp.]|uniref:pilin n=1 Tax=Dokdonella sp. TaxID=2291710 RepID=UPI003C664ADC